MTLNRRDWLIASASTVAGGSGPTGRFVTAYLREVASPTRGSFQEGALQAARECYSRTIAGAAQWVQENVPPAPGVLVRYSTFT